VEMVITPTATLVGRKDGDAAFKAFRGAWMTSLGTSMVLYVFTVKPTYEDSASPPLVLGSLAPPRG
jgi:hypothetical protein